MTTISDFTSPMTDWLCGNESKTHCFVDKSHWKRSLVSMWTVFNVDILFKHAQVGKDESIGARVERFLAMCRSDSVTVSCLVDLYTEVQREYAHKEAENANN